MTNSDEAKLVANPADKIRQVATEVEAPVAAKKKTAVFVDLTILNNPASAGVVTMLITSTLAQQLNLPANWTAIVVSLLIGGWVWGEVALHWSRRLISHFTNAFVIFMIASGVNASSLAAFQKLSEDSTELAVERSPESESTWLNDWAW